MKIWRATYHDDDGGSGTVQVWGTSKREVQATLRERRDAKNYFASEPERLNVPTTRRGLVDFLNRFADTG